MGDLAEGVMVKRQWWPSYPFAENDWIREKWALVSGEWFPPCRLLGLLPPLNRVGGS